jgi:hypothetical protein
MALLGVGGMLTILPAAPVLGQVIDPHSGTCNMIVPDSSGSLTGAEVEGTLFIRANSSWTTMTCHFDLTAEESPDKATHARGFNCRIPPNPVPTTDSRASASPGGRMVLTCRYKTSAL